MPEMRPSWPTRTAVSSPRDCGKTTCTSRPPCFMTTRTHQHALIAETMAVCTQHCLSEWMGGQVSDYAAASSVELSRTHANARTSNERLVAGLKSAAPSNVMTSDWHWSPYLRSPPHEFAPGAAGLYRRARRPSHIVALRQLWRSWNGLQHHPHCSPRSGVGGVACSRSDKWSTGAHVT